MYLTTIQTLGTISAKSEWKKMEIMSINNLFMKIFLSTSKY